jgi:hypothetical protein
LNREICEPREKILTTEPRSGGNLKTRPRHAGGKNACELDGDAGKSEVAAAHRAALRGANQLQIGIYPLAGLNHNSEKSSP